MIQTMSYSEMNHAVPGSTLNAHMERSLGCEVPSPSQWSDPCRSPLSLHSPVHFWGELEKIKEEPYSPPSNGSIIVLPRYRTSKDAQGETSINFTDLVSDSSAISNQRHLLESTGAQDHLNFRVKPEVDKRYLPFELDFLDDFVDVKTDEPFFGALSIPPAAPPLPQPTSSLGDRLRIVELMALDHWRQDIQNVSERLNIPKGENMPRLLEHPVRKLSRAFSLSLPDPTAWSVADVRTWLEFEAEQQGLPPPPVAHSWNFTGMDLMLLTEAQFRKLIPHGQLLYAKLEIWLEALRSSNDDHLEHLSPPESSASSSPPPPPAYAGPPPGSTLQTPPSRLTPPRLYAQPLSPSLELPTPVIRAECPAKSKCPDDPATPRKRQRNHQTPSPHIRGSFLEEACLDMSSLLEEETDNLSPVPSKRNSRLATISSTEIATSVAEEGAEEEPNCGRSGTHIHLWQFLKELLVRPQLYAPYIRWLDRKAGIFKIEDSTRVARLWGERKNRPAMNYDKLSRSIRQYYKKGIMKKTERSQRLVYQFCHPYGA